jgi:hypothetical protein
VGDLGGEGGVVHKEEVNVVDCEKLVLRKGRCVVLSYRC